MFFYTLEYIWLQLLFNERWQTSLKWAATIAIIIGAILVSVSVELANTTLPFICFLLGHIIWSVFAYLMKERPLFWLNFAFLPFDFYAILIRINT